MIFQMTGQRRLHSLWCVGKVFFLQRIHLRYTLHWGLISRFAHLRICSLAWFGVPYIYASYSPWFPPLRRSPRLLRTESIKTYILHFHQSSSHRMTQVHLTPWGFRPKPHTILKEIINLSTNANAKASHLKSPHDINISIEAHDAWHTLQHMGCLWLQGQTGVSTTAASVAKLGQGKSV